MSKFPKIELLAKAPEQEVLRLWQGLGYYSRARNLHQCAKIIAEKYEGHFPNRYEEIIKLPGIGPYTAAAIASFAFKEPVPAIDGNVFRVLARIFGIEDDIGKAKSRKAFYNISMELMPEAKPDLYNQAMMEFGATHCTPRSPLCETCIFNLGCYAYNNNQQNHLPVKKKKLKIKHRYFSYLVLQHDGKLLMRERKHKDIWQGLYDFILFESSRFLETEEMWQEVLFLNEGNIEGLHVTEEFLHVLSHQRIHAKFYTVKLNHLPSVTITRFNGQFLSKGMVNSVPKPVLISRYLTEDIFSLDL